MHPIKITAHGRIYTAWFGVCDTTGAEYIDISEDGVRAGRGRWTVHGIVDCPATLGPGERSGLSADEAQAISDEIYSAIEAAIRAVIADDELPRGDDLDEDEDAIVVETLC